TSIGAPTAGVAALDVPVVRLDHLDRGRGGRRTGGRRDHQLAQGCARGHDQHVGELARVARDRPLGRHGDAVGVDVGDRDLAARREARAGDGQLVGGGADGAIGCHVRLEIGGLAVGVLAVGVLTAAVCTLDVAAIGDTISCVTTVGVTTGRVTAIGVTSHRVVTVGVIASRVTTIGTTTSRVAAVGVTTRRVITVGGVG